MSNLIRSVVYADVRIVVHHRPDVDPLDDIMTNCDYNFMSQSDGGRVVATELTDWEVKNSRPLQDDELDELDRRL